MSNNAQTLLQGKRVIGVDNDADNKLILMLDDGTNVVIDAVNKYVGNGMTLAVLEVNQSADPILDSVDPSWAD